MIIYNTTFHIENEVHKECLKYLKKEYIPKAVSSGFMLNPCLRRVLQNEGNEGESYAIQFHVKNRDTLNFWLKQEGIALQQALVARFGSKIAGFTTLLEEIKWEDE